MGTAYHEPAGELSSETRNIHRALASLIEELEAVDWYHQRVDLSDDEPLREILAHNRDEEIEHAAMTLEWLRRKMPKFDEYLKTYLFTEGSITEIEEQSGDEEEPDQPPPATEGGSLGLGKFQKG